MRTCQDDICQRIVYDYDRAGKVKLIEVKGHSFAWSGAIPCTGVKTCIYCGCAFNEKEA